MIAIMTVSFLEAIHENGNEIEHKMNVKNVITFIQKKTLITFNKLHGFIIDHEKIHTFI